MTNEIYNVLDRAQSLIRDPKNWGRHEYARTSDGTLTDITDPNAFCFCTAGAVYRVLGSVGGFPASLQILARAIGDSSEGSIYLWNDNWRRTHAEVMAAFDRAKALSLNP
ncbi:DUF6197 family protein [Ensifer soli]|uniref:DUF6197 family protein n=1 Tax=Ciceribacter sp. sgz301302 TaxID=3342379 RepID=UPI0035B9EBC5